MPYDSSENSPDNALLGALQCLRQQEFYNLWYARKAVRKLFLRHTGRSYVIYSFDRNQLLIEGPGGKLSFEFTLRHKLSW